MTQQSAATLEGLLRRFSAFKNLDDDRLKWLAQKATLPLHRWAGTASARSNAGVLLLHC